MAKIKFEFDPHNRLTFKSAALRGIRKVVDGRFKISGQNSLVYHVKSPVPDGIKTPHQLKLNGTWSLNREHRLVLILNKWQRPTFGDQVTIQGEIVDVHKNSLLFAATTRTKEDMPSTYILELGGSWQADEQNRLTFKVNKGNGRFDRLTFEGIWQLDDDYQITYCYQKEQLVRKGRKIHTLTFKGHWDIRDKARLSYVLGSDPDSVFNFNTAIGIFKGDYIKYELGIGLSGKKYPVRRVIIFTGKWRLMKNLGLVFEVERENRIIQTLVFGAEAKLTPKSGVLFSLRNTANREIGVELELSQNIFRGDAQVFLRLLRTKQESAILAGAGWKW